jgi:hypothetical protein
MKKNILLLVILISINIAFFPHKAQVFTLNMKTGEHFAQKDAIYLSPIWNKSYDSHLFTFATIPKIADDVVTDVFEMEEQNGKTWSGKGPIYYRSYKSGVFFINRSGNAIVPPVQAYDIWATYFLLPSILIFFISLFYTFKKIKTN